LNQNETLPAPGRPHALPAVAHHEDMLVGEAIDLKAYARVIAKHKWVVLGTVAAVFAGVLVLTLLSTPIYRATTTLQIEREALKVVEFAGDQRPVEDGSSVDFYQTQYELLKSRALAERVVALLGARSAEAGQAAPHWKQLLGVDPGKGSDDAPSDDAVRRRAAAAIQEGLSVEPVRNSRLVRVHFDSPDPDFAALVANAVAQSFIEANLARRFDASSYARNYLEERLAQLKARLEDSERELVGFAQQEHIVSDPEGRSLSSNNLTELNSALSEAQSQRIRAEARWRQARASNGPGLPADMLANSIIHSLQESRAQLRSEYREKLGVYKPTHPEMVRLQAQIDEVQKQIAQELANIRASARAEYDAALRQERLLMSKMDAVRGDVLDAERRSIRYNILKREVDTNRELYDGLLQRYKEIGVAGGVSTNNISVVDSAQVPVNRFKPSVSRNLALALIFGTLLGLLLAFLREHLDETLRGADELEKLFGLPVLGTIPLIKGKDPLTVAAEPRSGLAEAYRSVRTALQFSTDAGVPAPLLISSATPGEGKSTTALLLAQNLAKLGKRVLLIDADLRNPALHRILGLDNAQGLSNYLAGAAAAGEGVQSTSDGNLWIMPSGPLPPNPAELLAGPRLAALMATAGGEYDQVIIDGPPIIGLADAPILAHLAAGTLLMVASGKTRRGEFQAAVKRLESAHARVIGTILTMYDPRQAGTSYAYGDYAYYTYGGGPDGPAPQR
jgi:capsular exopolysaccharide synthesis family protein